MSSSNMNYTNTPIQNKDCSYEGMKQYLITEGCKYITQLGKTEKNIKTYFLFIYNNQPFIRDEKEKRKICETIIELLDI